MENKYKTELIYTKKQSKKYNQGLKKSIKSDSDIYSLYHAKFNSKELKVDEGTPYPKGVNSVFQDGTASWDELNNQFYFTRSSGNYKKEDLIQLDLYSLNYSEIDEKIASPLSINLNSYSTLHPAVSPKNRRLYFSSDRPGGYGGMDLYYVAILPNNSFGVPVNLGPDINTPADEIFPFAYNEKFPFYSSKSGEGKTNLKLAIHKLFLKSYLNLNQVEEPTMPHHTLLLVLNFLFQILVNKCRFFVYISLGTICSQPVCMF